MPVPLPNPPAGPTPLPLPPQDPPTLIDIAHAIKYNKNILVSEEAGFATKDNVGEGAIYQAAIIAQNAGGAVAPPWFGPAITAALAPLLRIAFATYNLLSGDGRSRPFRVVPFVNGTLPTDPPHNLPALVDIAAINALTGQEATAYLNGYNRPVPNTIADRKRVIRLEIGCTVET